MTDEKLQEFEELHIGDKFITADNRILMKIRYAEEFNCVDIVSGIIATIYIGTYVVKADVKVIVGD